MYTLQTNSWIVSIGFTTLSSTCVHPNTKSSIDDAVRVSFHVKHEHGYISSSLPVPLHDHLLYTQSQGSPHSSPNMIICGWLKIVHVHTAGKLW